MFAEKTVVFIGGVWDLFHIGHLKAIKLAKTFGDILIVGVSTDELVYTYKNLSPIFSFEERFAIVDALFCVDHTIKQTRLANVNLLKALKVDVFVTGIDWKSKSVPGYAWIRENIRMEYIPRTKGISSSTIKTKLGREFKNEF